MGFFETSSRTGQNVQEAFYQLAKNIKTKQVLMQKQSGPDSTASNNSTSLNSDGNLRGKEATKLNNIKSKEN